MGQECCFEPLGGGLYIKKFRLASFVIGLHLGRDMKICLRGWGVDCGGWVLDVGLVAKPAC